MYEWSRVIFAKKSKFHNAGGPDTVVSPRASYNSYILWCSSRIVNSYDSMQVVAG